MTVSVPTLPVVGSSTDVWGQNLNDAITALVGQLANLDNTSDANKPISSAQATVNAAKAPLVSPAFTGVPTAPTATSGNSSTQLATTAFVTAAVGTGGGTGTVSDATTTSKGIVQLAGDLTGTAAAPALAAVIAGGTVGSSTQVPVITYDAKGRITSVGTAAPAAGGTISSDAVSASGYAVVADGLSGQSGSMTSGGTTLTFATGGLVSATHVGAQVRVAGAGASGALLSTTISSVTNGTTAVLATAAGATVSNAQVLIGHDNATPVLNALTAATGKKLTFPKGVYFLSTNVNIPANTVIDAVGATFLGGGFSMGSGSELRDATFIGDASGVYSAHIFIPQNAVSDFSIIGCQFVLGNWGILRNANAANGYVSRAEIRNNRFDQMQLGCTHIGQVLDSVFAHNISTNIKAGSNTFEFPGTAQRNDIHHNTVNGGRAGIIFLWTTGDQLAPTATQGWEVWGNHIHHNNVVGQSEEGISFDANYCTFDNATISAINTAAKTVTVSTTGFSTAGSKWAYSWVGMLSGTNASKLYRIQAQANATLTLEIDSVDIGAMAVGDAFVIGAPFHHNTIDHNYVDGRVSSTYSIWLYAFGGYNTVVGNTCEGATIGTASANSLAPVTGSLTGQTTSSPMGYNVIANNTVSNFSTVTATYSNGPGIELEYVQYGGQTDFYTYGNVVTGNVVPSGTIVGQRMQKLTANNIARGGASYTNTPTTSPLAFV